MAWRHREAVPTRASLSPVGSCQRDSGTAIKSPALTAKASGDMAARHPPFLALIEVSTPVLVVRDPVFSRAWWLGGLGQDRPSVSPGKPGRPRLGGGRLRRFARRLWRFARRLWLAVGGRCGFRRCFSLRRPLPGVTRHVVEALGEVPRGRGHLVEGVRRLSPDLPPSLVHQALQPLLVFLNPGKIIAALLGHTHGLPRPTPATQPGRAPREPGNGCHRDRSAKRGMGGGPRRPSAFASGDYASRGRCCRASGRTHPARLPRRRGSSPAPRSARSF